jgi:cyclophilin family peptidyl-prolyl cis-trans isomerase
MRLFVGVILCISLCVGRPAAAADSSPALADKSAANFHDTYQKWLDALAETAKLQAQLVAASSSDREAVRLKFADAVHTAEVLLPELQAAAEVAYVTDDTNKDLNNLLFVMAMGHLRKDNYEESLRLGRLLLEHHFAEKDKDLYRLLASSAFPTMQLDDAQKFVDEASGGKPADDPDLKSLVPLVEFYHRKWNREQQFRADEAKADDLPRVKIHTTQGDIVVELFENEAPNTVANFINLVERGFYDGTQFHRVIPGFVAQGGDPLSKEPAKNEGQIGHGGPGYLIPSESALPNHREHFRGSLSMALGEGPDSGGSQFFIALAPAAPLDGKYTVFGRVIEGLDVLSKLQRFDPQKATPGVTVDMLDKITKAEVLRKREHPYEPKVLIRK